MRSTSSAAVERNRSAVVGLLGVFDLWDCSKTFYARACGSVTPQTGYHFNRVTEAVSQHWQLWEILRESVMKGEDEVPEEFRNWKNVFERVLTCDGWSSDLMANPTCVSSMLFSSDLVREFCAHSPSSWFASFSEAQIQQETAAFPILNESEVREQVTVAVLASCITAYFAYALACQAVAWGVLSPTRNLKRVKQVFNFVKSTLFSSADSYGDPYEDSSDEFSVPELSEPDNDVFGEETDAAASD